MIISRSCGCCTKQVTVKINCTDNCSKNRKKYCILMRIVTGVKQIVIAVRE